MELKLPFGLKDGKIVDISQVDSGLACNCVCPSCNHPLVARKGNIMAHHFAHYKSAECAAALQTALHLAAKDILLRIKKIRIPEVKGYAGGNLGEGFNLGEILLHKEQTINFDEVFLEKRVGEIIPDIIIKINGKPMFIEIAVTHFIDEEKKKKIEELNVSTLEINLSKLDRKITLEELENILIDGIENKEWIFNTKYKAFENEVSKLNIDSYYGQGYSVVNRGNKYLTLDCPIKRRIYKQTIYADFYKDCLSCPYYKTNDGYKGKSYTWANITHERPTSVTCAGHAAKDIDVIVSKYSQKNK